MAYLITPDSLRNLKIIKNIEPSRIMEYKRSNGVDQISFELNVAIDKKNAILRDISRVDLFITKAPPEEIIQRYQAIPDVFFNVNALTVEQRAGQPNYVNTNLQNANENMLNALRNQFIELGVIPLDSIDILAKIDTTVVNKVKNNTITDNDAFGTVEKYVLIKNDPNANIELSPEKRTKKNTNYLKYNRQRTSENININQLSTKIKKYNGLGLNIISDKTSGLKKFISKERGNLSFKDRINGSHKRITSFQYAPQDIKRIIDYVKSIHNETIKGYFDTNSKSSLKLQTFSNRIENVKRIITVSEDYITSSDTYTLMAITYDKKRIKKEVEFGRFNIGSLAYQFGFPEFDFDFDVINEQKNNFIARITNNEKITRRYTIGIKENNNYKKSRYIQIGTVDVKSKESKNIKFKRSKNKNYSFIANCIYDQKEYSNSRFSHYRGNNQLVKTNKIDFYCENINEGILINAVNINSEYSRLAVLKRNLTKKEREYKNIATNGQNKYTILNSNTNTSIIDSDVEDKDVYEYKIEVQDKFGNQIISSNSFIEKYCLKKSIIDLSVNNKIVRNVANNHLYEIELGVTRKITDADKLVNSLLGNYYSLFEDKIKLVNEQNALIFDIEATAIRLSTGEQIPIGNYQLTDDLDKVNFSFSIPKDKYILKLSPRVILPNDLLIVLNTASNLDILPDSFINKETGDILYIKDGLNDTVDQVFNQEFTIENKRVKEIKRKESFNMTSKRISNIEKKYDVSFSILDPNSEIDFLIMSYTINKNEVVLYDIAGIPIQESNESEKKNFRYSYNIQDEKGVNTFIAQIVLKSGKFLNPFVIGVIENRE